MLNSDHLYYLVQVAKYGSITMAADKLHVTQPTISLAIKKLEESLGMQLLNRSFKGAHLTEEGRQVVQYAKIAFEYFDKIEEMVNDRHSSLMSEVTIHTIPALYYFLSDMTAEYYRQYPQGTFGLLKLGNFNLETLFAHNPDAFVLTISEVDRVFASDLAYVVLDSCRSYIRMRRDSDLLPCEQTSISCRELLNLPLIMVDTGEQVTQEFSNRLYDKLKTYGQPNVKFNVPDMTIAYNYLLSDLGVCFYCDFSLMRRNDPADTLMRKVLIKNAPKFNILLLYRQDHDPVRVRCLLELIDSAR